MVGHRDGALSAAVIAPPQHRAVAELAPRCGDVAKIRGGNAAISTQRWSTGASRRASNDRPHRHFNAGKSPQRESDASAVGSWSGKMRCG
jgi:hypothetical protein